MRGGCFDCFDCEKRQEVLKSLTVSNVPRETGLLGQVVCYRQATAEEIRQAGGR